MLSKLVVVAALSTSAGFNTTCTVYGPLDIDGQEYLPYERVLVVNTTGKTSFPGGDGYCTFDPSLTSLICAPNQGQGEIYAGLVPNIKFFTRNPNGFVDNLIVAVCDYIPEE